MFCQAKFKKLVVFRGADVVADRTAYTEVNVRSFRVRIQYELKFELPFMKLPLASFVLGPVTLVIDRLPL